MIVFKTETGSTYELRDDYSQIRRLEPAHELRRDGEWLDVIEVLTPLTVGDYAVFLLVGLGVLPTTIRTTSTILEIEHEPDFEIVAQGQIAPVK